MESIKDFLSYRERCPFCKNTIDFTKVRIQRSNNLRSSICDISFEKEKLLIDYLVLAYSFKAYLNVKDNKLEHNLYALSEEIMDRCEDIGYFSLSLICDCFDSQGTLNEHQQYRVNSGQVHINLKDSTYSDCVAESESISLYYEDGLSLTINCNYPENITTIYMIATEFSYFGSQASLPQPIILDHNININELGSLDRNKLRNKMERYRVLL